MSNSSLLKSGTEGIDYMRYICSANCHFHEWIIHAHYLHYVLAPIIHSKYDYRSLYPDKSTQ